VSSQTFTGGNLVTTPRQGSMMGTVVAEVTDGQNLVASVEFEVKVVDGTPAGRTSGPYFPDVTSRPGRYEFDRVLDALYPTIVTTLLRNEQGVVLASTAETFAMRNLDAVGTGGTLFVQDEDTGATAAASLVFQGPVLSVLNGVATVNLDSRYVTVDRANDVLAGYYTRGESDSLYATLSGAAFAGDVSTAGGRALLGMDASNGNAKLELGSSAAGGTAPYIDFHFGVGSAQDFNARLMNNADNTVTLAFAGAGIFNVQGTLQQNGTAVSLAGHTHDSRYLQMAGGTLTGQVTGTVFQTSGASAAFQVTDRAGSGLWAMYSSGNTLRWWNDATQTDRMTLSGGGNLAVAGTVQAAGAHPTWGGALLSNRNDWAGALHPTLSSAGGGGLIMLIRPHVPFVAGDGAYVRLASDSPVSAYWDMGTFGDQYAVRRQGVGAFLRIDSFGTTYLERTDDWNGDIPNGRYHLHLRSATDPARRLSLGYSHGGGPAGNGFGFIASGRLGVGWTPLVVQPGGGSVNVGINSGSAYKLNVEGSAFATGGFVSGDYLWLSSSQHASTVHGTASYIHIRSATGVRVEDYNGNGRGYLAYDATGFGLRHAGDGWMVRGWNGGVELRGQVMDELQNPYAISLSGTANPTGVAREGALYIQY
jgi:hypothetical protein